MNTIVVGIDGLDESKAALRWAAREAELRGASLRVVHASATPDRFPGLVLHGPADAYPGDAGTMASTESRLALDLIERELEAVGGDAVRVPVERHVAEGDPATALLEAAAGAELLVLGSSHHGSFERTALGDVVRTCAARASCPVVVVPYRR